MCATMYDPNMESQAYVLVTEILKRAGCELVCNGYANGKLPWFAFRTSVIATCGNTGAMGIWNMGSWKAEATAKAAEYLGQLLSGMKVFSIRAELYMEAATLHGYRVAISAAHEPFLLNQETRQHVELREFKLDGNIPNNLYKTYLNLTRKNWESITVAEVKDLLSYYRDGRYLPALEHMGKEFVKYAISKTSSTKLL